ncbi:Uncharacterised protein [Bordetella pertussis]|nr:Uncharacterised protein [Bordetella pertussis]CPM10940.1 Uncharacterised protein [Bordetella pertussis]CPP14100.1 Uncharacterised protein [Bordetella pertussis]
MPWMNDRMKPATMAGMTNGKVTLRMVRRMPPPSMAEASSSSTAISSSAVATMVNVNGTV